MKLPNHQETKPLEDFPHNPTIDSACEYHNPITKTALLVAWLRTFSDRPICQQLAKYFQAEKTTNEFTNEIDDNLSWMAPRMESRNRSLQAKIEEYIPAGHRNILILAAGLCPIGSELRTDSQLTVVETDLPDIIKQKEKAVNYCIDPAKNHYFHPLNVTSTKDFAETYQTYFSNNSQPITVTTEGLLPYLTREELRAMCRNIHSLFDKQSGIWLATDLIFRPRIKQVLDNIQSSDPKIRARAKLIKNIFSTTNTDWVMNSFENEDEFIQFMKDNDFSATAQSATEIIPANQLVSYNKLTPADQQNANPSLASNLIWILKPR
jgi:O-methyltransferase involved in polyketide biosynthesis